MGWTTLSSPFLGRSDLVGEGVGALARERSGRVSIGIGVLSLSPSNSVPWDSQYLSGHETPQLPVSVEVK